MITVSVIVPCYNAENHVSKCMDSLVTQTLENMEIILVNDASEDSTFEILKKYEEQHDNIKLIDSSVNLKPGAARNIAIDIAEGKYIAFLDSDDWVDSTMYEKLYHFAEENDYEIASCFHHHIHLYIDNADEIIMQKNKMIINALKSEGNKTVYRKICVNDRLAYGVSDAIYNKEFLLQRGIYFPENLFHEESYVRFFSDYLSSKKGALEEILYCHFARKDSITSLKNDLCVMEDDLTVKKLILEDAKRIGIFNHNRDEIEKYFVDWYGHAIINAIKNFDDMPLDWMKEVSRFITGNFPNYANNIYLSESDRAVHIILRLNDIAPQSLYDAVQTNDKLYELIYNKPRKK